MNILTIQKLNKSFGKFQALTDVSFSLEAGRIYGFVGNNGAGKTTVFRVLAGLVTPDSGTVSLFGESDPRGLRRARTRMGYLLPRESFSEDMTALNNLIALQKLRGYTDKGEALRLLASLGIELDKASRWRLQSLSTGEFQRTALAACLLGDPELLLMDEPQNGLDPTMVHELRKLLLRLKDQGKTIFLSSHLLSELYQLATDYVFIHKGRIIAAMTHSDLEAEAGEGLENYFLKLTQRAEP